MTASVDFTAHMLKRLDVRFDEQQKLFAQWFAKLRADVAELTTQGTTRRQYFALSEQFRRLQQEQADLKATVDALRPDIPS